MNIIFYNTSENKSSIIFLNNGRDFIEIFDNLIINIDDWICEINSS